MSSGFTRNLAWTLLAGPWLHDELAERTRIALQRSSCPLWASQLVDRLVAAFGEGVTVPLRGQLEYFLAVDARYQKRIRKWNAAGSLPKIVVPPQGMTTTVERFRECSLPELTNVALLASWLAVSVSEIDWFAGLRRRERKHEKEQLRHYRYNWISANCKKRRLLECPKPRLKAIQRAILDDLLMKVPTHDAAHGFCRGRSVTSYLEPHVARDAVLTIDLRHFFPSVRASRVNAIFRAIGYPEVVSQVLTGLCTNSVPEKVLKMAGPDGRKALFSGEASLYRDVHLPQGAPTSPTLANLAAFRLDRRLAGLARQFGAFYTRYADDLAFSGGEGFRRGLSRFSVLACAIAVDEGFSIRHRKTRVMYRGHRQQVTGLVLNDRLNIPRHSYDELKAILHNCVKFGPSSQNRDSIANFDLHLSGRISWVTNVNPDRGAKLRSLFEQIDWDC